MFDTPAQILPARTFTERSNDTLLARLRDIEVPNSNDTDQVTRADRRTLADLIYGVAVVVIAVNDRAWACRDAYDDNLYDDKTPRVLRGAGFIRALRLFLDGRIALSNDHLAPADAGAKESYCRDISADALERLLNARVLLHWIHVRPDIEEQLAYEFDGDSGDALEPDVFEDILARTAAQAATAARLNQRYPGTVNITDFLPPYASRDVVSHATRAAEYEMNWVRSEYANRCNSDRPEMRALLDRA